MPAVALPFNTIERFDRVPSANTYGVIMENWTFLSVGQPFPSSTLLPAHDCAFADLSSNGRLYFLSQMNRMTSKEKQAITGAFKARAWSLEVMGVPICGLLARMGTLPWQDSTIFVNLPERHQAGVSFIKTVPNALDYYILDQGILKRLGLFGLRQQDCELLAESFQQQMQREIRKQQWDTAIAACYARYTTDDLVRMSMAQRQ